MSVMAQNSTALPVQVGPWIPQTLRATGRPALNVVVLEPDSSSEVIIMDRQYSYGYYPRVLDGFAEVNIFAKGEMYQGSFDVIDQLVYGTVMCNGSEERHIQIGFPPEAVLDPVFFQMRVPLDHFGCSSEESLPLFTLHVVRRAGYSGIRTGIALGFVSD